MSDGTGTTATETGAGGEQTQAASIDFGPVFEYIDQRVGNIGEDIAARFAPEVEQEAEVDSFMEEFGDIFENPADAEAEQLAAEQQRSDRSLQALQALAQRAQGSDDLLNQMAQRLDAIERRDEADAVMQRLPDLQNPEVAAQAVEAADQMAQRLGMPQLAGSAEFVALVYQASRAEALAQSGVPAGDEHVHLETAGGAGPVPQDEDIGKGIVTAMGGGSLWGRTAL